MELDADARRRLQEKWANIAQILNRYENASVEELTMTYFLVDSLAEKLKHGIRHRIENTVLQQRGIVYPIRPASPQRTVQPFPTVRMPGQIPGPTLTRPVSPVRENHVINPIIMPTRTTTVRAPTIIGQQLPTVM